jgi:hypothetical protein
MAGMPVCQTMLRASDVTRRLTGIVKGPDGKAVAGGVVKLKNLVTLEIRSFITLKDGTYRFGGLNPDIEYEVWASYQDGSSRTRTLSKFDSAKEPVIDLKVESR